jgi:ribosomal protein L40E
MAGPASHANRARCPCGAVLTFPAGALGKRVRCPNCGRVFRVQAMPAPPAAPVAQAQAPAETASAQVRTEICPGCRAKLPAGTTVCPRCGYNFQTRAYASAIDEEPPLPVPDEALAGAERGFWADALWSFMCFADSDNMVVLLIVCAISVLGEVAALAPGIGWICQFIVLGWLCSFYFNVLLQAASGEDDLPRITLTEGWVDGVIRPGIMFIVSWLVVLLPGLVYGAVSGASSYVEALLSPASGMWSGGVFPPEVIVFVFLTLLGAFCWPSAVLLMSMFSIASVFRVDLWIRTIIRTLPTYVAICGLLAIIVVVQTLVTLLAHGAFGASRGADIGAGIFGSIVSAYGWIVTMRIIGLYYLHYKHRFPWRAE